MIQLFKEILVPTDGSEGVTDAINCAVAMAKTFNCRIHILHVIESPRLQDYGAFFALPEIMKELQAAGDEVCKNALDFLSQSGFDNAVHEKSEGYPADEILDYARANAIDLIVMGTHGRRGINRVVLGSIAEEVVRRSEVPVMTVRMSQPD